MTLQAVRIRTLALSLALLTLLAACGGDDGAADEAAAASDAAARVENQAIMEAHFANFPSLPPDVREAFERGEISQEEIDARTASGEFGRFFNEGTPADIPTDLQWLDGSDLPDLGSPDAVKGGTLHLSLQDFPRTLRRLGTDANSGFRGWILDNTAMTMGRRHPNVTEIVDSEFRYIPGIASAWAIDRPNRTVYVRIDPEARFNDGEPITTDDIFFSFYLWQSPWIQQPWYNNFATRSFSSITRYDDKTYSVTLPEAKPNMLGTVLEQFEPFPKHFFADFGPDYNERYQWDYVPSSGPYLVHPEDVKKGRSITLTRIDDWWAKDRKFWRNRYNYDRIQFGVVRDIAKAFEAFRKGEQDIISLSLPEYFYDKLPDSDPLVAGGYVQKVVFYNDRPRPTYGLWMNSSRPLLENRDVRVGIQFATNWQKVIDEYFRGDYTRMRTSADGYGSFTHPDLQPRHFDVDAALESFARAGFTERGPDGVLVNGAGQRLSFTLSTGYESLKDVLTILREEALAAGLELRLEVLDATAAWKKVQEKQHDIHFVAFGVSPEMYPRYWETYHSVNAYDRAFLADGSVNPDRKVKTQSNNLQVIAIPELDALIERYRGSDDADEMRELAFQMEEILFEDASFSPGFVLPFYRLAAWRWLRWPEDFDVRISGGSLEGLLGWIEPGAREETEAARDEGRTFPPEIHVHDQYRPQ
ncbi:MAG TPA: extracellular solute-binding protein [Pseudomonadales bacterium]|nr:extracellular solute-binding protein [Pseudomonadales bacterium]